MLTILNFNIFPSFSSFSISAQVEFFGKMDPEKKEKPDKEKPNQVAIRTMADYQRMKLEMLMYTPEMVVVGSTRIKNVAAYSPQINEDVSFSENETMAAKAILICRPNSHHFLERTLGLDQPIKVGRSVARAKPTPSNAIFDCKVLSRHHALLWYENGKFFLQDTKSSNGTFVNNNRLSTENHEVSSGDIVQFGVDVVENNRKVTHGCIIATLRLYLPDGKEAKASPSITEGNRHGVVPLDDLYKLNQILQEANQREQCLESKLNALQHVVEETKKSAEESWQAYVGEERLLSRLSALETQLQQARTNWSEDRLKEEIAKLRENNEQYQEAAKGALEKVHAEKLEAVSLAMEQERAKISAEQDALLAKEQLAEAQDQLQEVAQKLTDIQTRADDEKQQHEKHIRELEQHMEEEEAKVIELEAKIYELTLDMAKKYSQSDHIEQRPDLIFEDDMKTKEEILAENEIISESILNKTNSNGFEQNHVSLTVAPVEEKGEHEKSEDLGCDSVAKNDDEGIKEKEESKRVSFKLPEEDQRNEEESQNGPETDEPEDISDKNDFSNDHIDSKTLKYQYQSAQKEQNELRRKIDILEKISETNKTKITELNQALSEEKALSGQRLTETENVREELLVLEQKWRECCNDNQQLKDRVNSLIKELDKRKERIKKDEEKIDRSVRQRKSTENVRDKEDITRVEEVETSRSEETEKNSFTLNTSLVTTEQLMNLEEELVLLKERYAQSCDDKVQLQRDLLKMRVQYDMLCDNVYNKYFWYIAPLVIIVLYLLVSAWIS